MAIAYGADAIGLVSDMPSGPGIIDDELVREIAQATPPGVDSFLLTSRNNATEIVEHVEYCGPTTVQIVRHIDPAEYPELQRHLSSKRLVQVIHVEDDSALDLIPLYSPFVHAFLLDSGKPNADKVTLGGTGDVHDWEISQRFVESSTRPVYLAGGIRAENVGQAIQQVQPWGLDLCSSVRRDGQLDQTKLARFMEAASVSRHPAPN